MADFKIESQISMPALTNEIKVFLASNDLLNITPKLVRVHLEKLFMCDLTDKKTLIDQIIVDELQRIHSENNANANGTDNDGNDDTSECEQDDFNKELLNETKPVKVSDEQLAKIIYSEEIRNQRSKRPTTAASTASSKKKKTGTQSTSEKNETTPKRKTAFNKDVQLSPALCEIVGKQQCSRSEIVKTMWKYFKDNNLIDPKNKQFVVCDEKLERIFMKKKFKAFGMMKDLKKQIYDIPSVKSV